ncbi:MAG: hypothetical protein AAGD28_17785 [Bacteroidota bacterium]
MGIGLDLFVADESIESPFLLRAFLEEIIWEQHAKYKDFLSPEEEKILRPNIAGEVVFGKKREATFLEKAKLPFMLHRALKGKISVEQINKFRDKLVHRSEKVEDRERNPKSLKEVLEKVEQYFIEHAAHLPQSHFLYRAENAERHEFVYSIEIEGIDYTLEGDNFLLENYPEIRDQIQLKSHGDEQGKVDRWIKVEPIMFINEQKYYARSVSKAEQFREEFQKCYDFLDQAIEQKKRVLWEFD